MIIGRRFPGNPAPFKKIIRKDIRNLTISYRRGDKKRFGTLFDFFGNLK